ncbi:MAG: VCBS repeat-containing protein, partial [Candidatus Eisenbacteria bacterium]|nr:VCBS repeat-containing protein [Candidatus Eisenbacteria bacterium]
MRLDRTALLSIPLFVLVTLFAPSSTHADGATPRALPIARPEPSTSSLDGAGRLLPIWQAAGASRDAIEVELARGAGADAAAKARREAKANREQGARPDNPGGLMRERWEMMTAGDTTVTAKALIDAKSQLVEMEAVSRRAGPFGALDAGLGDWEWLGPQNVGGRTRAVLFNPGNANHIWAGTATGGISTSFDGGFSWSIVDDFLPSLSVTSLAIDTNPNFLYAGTGEFAEFSTATGGGFNGAGIFRSTDFGVTWTQLPATAPWVEVSRLAAVPADGFLFAATNTGLFRSSNSGASWSLVLAAPNLRDVKATATSHVLLVGSTTSSFRSTDSGATWTTLSGAASGLPPVPTTPAGATMRTEFVIAPNQTTCFASVDRNGGEVWRSLDAGATWQMRRSGDQYLAGQGWYDNAVWVDPTNANVVVVAGIDVWRSTDGGSSFARISDWAAYPGGSAHADHHAIVSPPNYNGTTNRRVYFGNDGGIQRKDDILAGTGDWTNLSNGLRSTQFYKGAIQAGTNDLLGGLQDNGTWRRTGTNNWTSWYGGDGGYCSFDASGTNQYFEYINLLMYKNGIFGLPFACTSGLTDAGDGCNSRFIAPFKADPVVAGRLFAGGSSIWRSTNSADSWTSVRGPISSVANPNPGCALIRPLCSAIELVSSNSQLVWVGYANGTVSVSADNGANWTNVDNGSTPLPNRIVTDIAVNPSNTNEVWVTFGGFNPSNVWFTSDGGSTWAARAGSGSTALPSAPVETITMHPSNRSWIYAGTALGVLASQDKGLTWGLMRRHAQSEGPAYTQVSDLVWEGNRLVAFTYGRGVFRSGPIGGSSSGPAIALLGTSLPGANSGSCDWGDFDSDGDLDILWTGNSAPSDTLPAAPITRIGRNDGGGNFSLVTPALPGVTDGAARWGDVDRDGDLDVAITGMLASGLPTAAIYLNSGGTFAPSGAVLEPVSKSDQVWGDFDNDGDLDLVVSGLTAPTSTNTGSTKLYRNDGGWFTDAGAGLMNVQHSSLDAGDYDNDGDLDLLLAGWLGSSASPVTLLYRNDGGSAFTNVTFGLPNVEFSAEWGDYDMDGDVDMLLSGSAGLWVHRNNGGGSFATVATLPAHLDGEAAWGDYDNDGDLDIAVTGKDGITQSTRLYRNDAGAFTDTGARLNGAQRSSLAWGDFDNDGDVDLFLNGWANVANVAQVYRNDIATLNTPPWAPTGLTANTEGCGDGMMRVTFSWNASPLDDHTFISALSYNLRIGSAPGLANVFAPAASLGSGFRRVAARGNAQQRRSWTLTLPTGTYYWSVQALDGSMKGSVFSGEAVARVATHYADAGASLTPTTGAVSWGDFDGDDDLDLLVTGVAGSDIHRNDGGSFTPIGAGLPALDYSSSQWGDYDGDGDLDIVLSGCVPGTYVTSIYRNDGGTFHDIGAGLAGVCGGSVAWADWDRDGDLDLALTGQAGTGAIARIYLNDAGFFWDMGAPVAGVDLGPSAWGDYDGDGDPDLLVTGRDDALVRHADLYRNDGGGAFSLVFSGLPPVSFGSVAWADYDKDGDQDLLLAGSTGVGADQIARVYNNDGTGNLTDIFAGLTGIQEGSAHWGDLDNDGRLDLLLTGYNPTVGRQARTYLGTAAGTFLAAAGNGLPPVFDSHADLGDYDGDGALDIALTGRAGPSIAKVFHSCGAAPNAPPAAPSGLAWSRNGGELTLSWDAAADDHAATGAGLTYNVRVGTTPGGQDVLSAMSNTSSGFRRVPRPGNAGERLSWKLAVPDQRYYWSVQAVDAGYRAGPFAA